MTDTIQEEMSDIVGDADSSRVVSYYCSLVMNQNELEDLVVPFYYENVYPCSEDASIGRDFVADALLTRAKRDFLLDASYCTNPQRDPWFGRVSSLPEDEIVSSSTDSSSSGGGLTCGVLMTNEYNEQMQDLIANGADPMQEVEECCVVVHGSMTFAKLASLEDENIMYQWVADQLNDNGSTTVEGSATLNINSGLAFPYRTHYLGAILEVPSVEDNLPPAININDGNSDNGTNNDGSNFTDITTPTKDDDNNSNNDNNNNPAPLPDSSLTDVKQPTASNTKDTNDNDSPKQFTWLGVLLAIGLVVALVAVVYLIIKRRRKLAKGHKVQAAVDSSAELGSSSPRSGRSLSKEQSPPVSAVTKSWKGRLTRGARGAAAAAEATTSVEEDACDSDDLGIHVTIVPTHTDSTHSGGSMQGYPPQQRQQYGGSRSHDDEYDGDDDENAGGGGFVEMLHDDDNIETNDYDGAHPFQVSVLSDNPNMKIQAVSTDSYHTSNNQEEHDDFFAPARSVGGGASRRRHHGNGGATQTTGSTSSGKYQFDLADANRSAIMGTYMMNGSSAGGSSGAAAVASAPPITMTVVPPYSMDETSDSDIDSWAQTEGTVGSLEDRYEETGEI